MAVLEPEARIARGFEAEQRVVPVMHAQHGFGGSGGHTAMDIPLNEGSAVLQPARRRPSAEGAFDAGLAVAAAASR